MNAVAPNLEIQVEDSPAVEAVSQAENDASFATEPEIFVWNFDPSICG
ncbi:MAG TPA: hypothetical protein PLM98_06390 [Thiolinea sp.]|nr:hypothetical protein [Thiolinea sp.]